MHGCYVETTCIRNILVQSITFAIGERTMLSQYSIIDIVIENTY